MPQCRDASLLFPTVQSTSTSRSVWNGRLIPVIRLIKFLEEVFLPRGKSLPPLTSDIIYFPIPRSENSCAWPGKRLNNERLAASLRTAVEHSVPHVLNTEFSARAEVVVPNTGAVCSALFIFTYNVFYNQNHTPCIYMYMCVCIYKL